MAQRGPISRKSRWDVREKLYKLMVGGNKKEPDEEGNPNVTGQTRHKQLD
jgi:hypothetical protein